MLIFVLFIQVWAVFDYIEVEPLILCAREDEEVSIRTVAETVASAMGMDPIKGKKIMPQQKCFKITEIVEMAVMTKMTMTTRRSKMTKNYKHK